MYVKPEDFAKSGVNFAVFFANTAFESLERLVLLNMAASRSVFEATLSNLSAVLGAKDVHALIEIQKGLAAPSVEQGMAYSRNVIAIATETKEKIAKEVEAKVAETNAQVSGLVEKALASAPAGSEAAVAAVKTAIKTANEAYEGLNKAAKQAAEVAEASVAAVTDATMKAAKKVA